MSDLSIHPVTEADAAEILAFEQENRSFFRAMVPDRGDPYFSLDYLREMLREAVQDQAAGRHYLYLVRNPRGEVVGRVNLYDVRQGNLKRAELGYRIGERWNGRGYATRAVNLALAEAFGRCGLHRVQAVTSPENIGSQMVLIRNGFRFVGRSTAYLQVGERWVDGLHYEILAEWYRQRPAAPDPAGSRGTGAGEEQPERVPVRIRPVRPEDAPDLNQICRGRTVMPNTYGLPTEREMASRRFVENLGPDDHVLVAETDGRVVGVAGLHLGKGRGRHAGTIGISIHDDYQGRGIGRALMAALLDLADNHLNLERVELDVRSDNTRAIALYKSLGFIEEGVRRGAFFAQGAYRDLLLMARTREGAAAASRRPEQGN